MTRHVRPSFPTIPGMAVAVPVPEPVPPAACRRSRPEGWLWGLGAAVIWSGWWTVTRIGASGGLPAPDLAALRFGISGVLLLPLAWRMRLTIRKAGTANLFFMAVGAGAPYALVAATGVRLASAGTGGAVTVGLMPLFTTALAVPLLGERMTRGQVAGLGCILTGVACIALQSIGGPHGRAGLGLFILGAMMWSGYAVAMRRSGLPAMVAAAVVCLASLLLYLPGWMILRGPGTLLAAAPSDLMLQAVYQSLLSAIAALYCFSRAVHLLGAARASVFAALVPGLSVIIAALVLHEAPGPWQAGGAGLLSIGAVVAGGASAKMALPGFDLLARAWRGWRHRHQIAATRRTLSRLSDMGLKDIGLHRSELIGSSFHNR